MTEPRGLTPDETAAMTLAKEALARALERDWDAALRAVELLTDLYHAQGTHVALLVWADAVVDSRGGPITDGIPPRLDFHDVSEPGWPAHTVDDADPRARWAARFVVARAMSDFQQCRALIASCGTPDQYTENLLGMLEVAAHTIPLARPDNHPWTDIE